MSRQMTYLDQAKFQPKIMTELTASDIKLPKCNISSKSVTNRALPMMAGQDEAWNCNNRTGMLLVT